MAQYVISGPRRFAPAVVVRRPLLFSPTPRVRTSGASLSRAFHVVRDARIRSHNSSVSSLGTCCTARAVLFCCHPFAALGPSCRYFYLLLCCFCLSRHAGLPIDSPPVPAGPIRPGPRFDLAFSLPFLPPSLPPSLALAMTGPSAFLRFPHPVSLNGGQVSAQSPRFVPPSPARLCSFPPPARSLARSHLLGRTSLYGSDRETGRGAGHNQTPAIDSPNASVGWKEGP